MKLTEEQKQKVLLLDQPIFKDDMYKGLDEETRKKLGQFYTPGKLVIQMLEKYEVESLKGLTILDPTCGSGNLLVGCILAGADPDKVFGNEYDATAVKLCRKRLARAAEIMGFSGYTEESFKTQVHRGNALQKRCITEFSTMYDQYYSVEYIDEPDYASGKYSWKVDNERFKAKYDSKNVTQLSLF